MMADNPYVAPTAANEALGSPKPPTRRREWSFVSLSLASFFVLGTALAELFSYVYRYDNPVYLASMMPVHIWLDLSVRLIGRFSADLLGGFILGRFVRPSLALRVVIGLVGYLLCVQTFLLWWRGAEDPHIAYIGVAGLFAYRAFPLLTIFPVIALGIWLGRCSLAEPRRRR